MAPKLLGETGSDLWSEADGKLSNEIGLNLSSIGRDKLSGETDSDLLGKISRE